ncbi:DUF2779 domain-containing protein [Pseudobutyrivibrio sp. MD2005]|uniref:DUF2779 domain-containing protein n=1 Tax=Pseudobutyrivibrio sp. MD2005 TaxID=1410616 RepID=UPI000480CC27|nr:DUF2779 domain-containing protein [Pseudobutyrivibrio sp. MD2005]
MVTVSKSKYCKFMQCPKMAWLDKYHPELIEIDAITQARFDTGHEVGDLAKGLFGNYVDVSTFNKDGLIDIPAMLKKTKEELANNTPVICEAAFSIDGLYCAVDLLRHEEDGWSIYEVKSSTCKKEVDEVYIIDISFQRYVLEKAGIIVKNTYLVNINNKYVFDGTMDISQFFAITDITSEVKSEMTNVASNIKRAREILGCNDMPNIDLGEHCCLPYECSYWNYCTRNLPKPNVFSMYHMAFKNKIELYKKGLVSYKALQDSNARLTSTQHRQIQYQLNDLEPYIDTDGIRDFLSNLSYPLYFLDFETVQPVIPIYEGTKPYQQIPFQYSLHYIEYEGGPLQHKEFLGISGEDPRRAIAEALVRDIPMNVCTTAYNKAFECTRLKELANTFPDLAEHLLNIQENILDLLVPFQSGYYYNRAMGGSFSIKSVLPALFPDDPTLDYHNLEDIQNGGDAMTIFPRIKDMSPSDQKRARQNLLKYCELDTFAMVKVWEELVKVANE